MKPSNRIIVDRPLLAALPLPLAQAWRRALYAEPPAVVHERALYTLEAVLKYLAGVAAASWVAGGAQGKNAREECTKLVRPSLGIWAAILRECTAALPESDATRQWLTDVLATPLADQMSELPGRRVEDLLAQLPNYRNTVAGHGAGLSAADVADRAPALMALARQSLAALVSEQAPILMGRAGGRWVQLVGPTAQLEMNGGSVSDSSLLLQFSSHSVSLAPLWLFDAEEDDVLVLNKVLLPSKKGGSARVEYLSYGAPRGNAGLATFKGPAVEAARQFLERATGQAHLGATDVGPIIDRIEVEELARRVTGERYGSYQVVRKVAEGGQGVLFEAIQESPPRRVALKTLRMETALYAESCRRLREEGAALARVEHPGVVPVYETGETDGVPWIAMQFIEGKSLAQVLDALRGHAGPMTLAEWNRAAPSSTDRPAEPKPQTYAQRLAELGRDAARALSACHARGIIHRDIKPGNLMLDAEGRVILTDFGLARPTDPRPETFTQDIVGTLQYLAPEALLPAGRKGPDARVDVYGLGATLYEALCFQAPFAAYAQDRGALLQAVQQKDPQPLRKLAPWVPYDLETIILKAMEKDRDRRYASANELAHELDRFLNDEPIQARRPGPIVRLRKWTRRHPGRAMAAVALVLVSIGFSLWGREALQRQQVIEQSRQQVLRDVSGLEGMAQAQITASRYADATRTLQQAVRQLETVDHPELARRRGDVEARLDRAHRLAEFERLSFLAWFRTGEERQEEAQQLCADGLRAVHVLEHADWWNYLPIDDLDVQPQQQMRDEVYRLLLLDCALKSRPVVLNLGKSQVVAEAARQVWPTLDRIQAWEQAQGLRPSKTGQVVARICRLGSAATGGSAAAGATPIEPTNSADYFCLGALHFFIGMFTKDPVSGWAVRFVLRDFPDLDAATPLETAAYLLRTAAALSPHHYWPHFLLGWTLLNKPQPDCFGAEQAFTACVQLQPENPRGYEWRALAILREVPQQRGDTYKQELRQRAIRDSEHALGLALTDPSAWWTRAEFLALLDQPARALDAYARALELEDDIANKLSRRNGLDLARTYAMKQLQLHRNATDADGQALCAQAHALLALLNLNLAVPKLAAARDEATQALAVRSTHPQAARVRSRALAVRGTATLASGSPTQALADLDEALRADPANYLAALNRARAYERLNQWDRALTAYEYLLSGPREGGSPIAATDAQRREAEQGQARVLAQLGPIAVASRER